MRTKPCARCGTEIPRVRGRLRFCSPCRIENDREKSRDSAARERLEQPDRVRERQRRYATANRDKINAKSRELNAKSPGRADRYHDDAHFGGLKTHVLERDGHRCRLCNATAADGKRHLTIHHIDGSKDHNVMWNLITLCRRCHPKVHNHWHGATRQVELYALLGVAIRRDPAA